MKLVAIFWILTLAVIAATPAFSQPAVDPKFLIVPGKSVGALRVGMTIDEVRAAIGNEVSSGQAPNGITLYRFGAPSQTFNVYTQGGKVIAIYTFLPEYKTAKGVGVGSSFAELTAAYGSPKSQNAGTAVINGKTFNVLFLDYDHAGLMAVLDRATQTLIAFGI